MDAASHSPALALAVISGFLLFAGGFWTIVCVGQWALGPAERIPSLSAELPAAIVSLPLRFSVLEFLLLMVQVQLGVLTARIASGGDVRIVMLVGSCVAAIVGLTWWHAMQRLASAGVSLRLKRTLFVALVAPLNALATVGAMGINAWAVFQLLRGGDLQLGWWLAGNFGIAGTFVICRGLTGWVMRCAPPAGAAESTCAVGLAAPNVSTSGRLG